MSLPRIEVLSKRIQEALVKAKRIREQIIAELTPVSERIERLYKEFDPSGSKILTEVEFPGLPTNVVEMYRFFIKKACRKAQDEGKYWTLDLELRNTEEIRDLCFDYSTVALSKEWRLIAVKEDILTLVKLAGHRGPCQDTEEYWVKTLGIEMLCSDVNQTPPSQPKTLGEPLAPPERWMNRTIPEFKPIK